MPGELLATDICHIAIILSHRLGWRLVDLLLLLLLLFLLQLLFLYLLETDLLFLDLELLGSLLLEQLQLLWILRELLLVRVVHQPVLGEMLHLK